MDIKTGGETQPNGRVGLHVVRNLGELKVVPPPRFWRMKNFLQHRARHVPAEAAATFLGHLTGMARLQTSLSGVVYRRRDDLASWELQALKKLMWENHPLCDLPRFFGGELMNYGLLSTRLVTNNGVGFIVDAFQNLTELENMKFHGYGTGTTAEAAGDSALVTELTTQYNPDSTRPTGSQTETSSNIYRTVGTLSPDSGGTIAITEHGIFSAASAGVLLDRSVFSAVNLVAGQDSLQTTYDFTITAGS